jgi:hypothetical protein
MALQATQQDGLWAVTGLTRQNTPFTMGRRLFQAGEHWVGFDDSFAEPLVVKALYAPSADQVYRLGASFVGYMQFAQLTFEGIPVPPSVYGGRLAERAPYVTSREHGYHWVDFMGPADANLRTPRSGETQTGAFDPFYPFNALLVRGDLPNTGSLAQHPLPNGSLFYPGQTGANATLAASLTGEVAAGLKTEAGVQAVLDDDSIVATIAVTPQQLAASEPYRIAFDFLVKRGDLEGLELASLAGEVVGKFVLLTLPDPENEAPVLCVYSVVRNLETYVVAHVLSEDEVDAMDEDAGTGALLRAYEYLKDAGLSSSAGDDRMEPGPVPRGRGGLTSNPFPSLSEFPFRLRYHTHAFAWQRYQRSGSYFQPMSGFSWAVLFHFDEDTRRLLPAAVERPREVASYDFTTPLRQYYAALADPQLRTRTIDTSNFTRAAMLRDNLAAGTKLRFVDADGADAV